MKTIYRNDLGLPSNLWGNSLTRTTDTNRVSMMIDAAVGNKIMVAIMAPPGAGKTEAIKAAIKSHARIQTVAPIRVQREQLHAGNIEEAFVRELSDESPKRSAEARSYQVQRILGQSQTSGPILLIIDDYHVVHGNTLRALKRLREFSWMGVAPLFGTVLIGQKDKTASIEEVRLRSDQYWFTGLNRDEIVKLLTKTLKHRITKDAALLLANHQDATRWLSLTGLVDHCLATICRQGKEVIDDETVASIISPETKTQPVAQNKGAVSQRLQQLNNQDRKVA